MQLAAGSRLGPYEIVAPLGAGGMGEVYRARDPRLERDIAIKVLPAALANDPLAHARFEREARAIAALSHPNILAIHDVGRANDVAYAVTELLEGRTLRDMLAGGALPIGKAIEYALQIAHGLAAAHARAMVHRDVKPENVFVCSDGRLKILDFGLAHAIERHPERISDNAATVAGTTPGMIVGTVGYMSPEQIRGQEADARADIFAFGAILYEMLSGQRAFHADTRADLLSAVLRSEPADISGHRPEVPPALDHLVRRCLEKSPDERFGSARDLAYALEAISTGTSARAAATTDSVRTPHRRSRVLALVAAAAVGLALGAAATRWLPPRQQSASLATRFIIPTYVGVPPWVAVSPNGQSIAWSALDPREYGIQVWIRGLSDREARIVGGSRGFSPVVAEWHPDSRRLVIVSNQITITDVTNNTERVVFTPTAVQRETPPHGLAVREDDVLLGSTEGLVRLGLSGASTLTTFITADKSRYMWYGYPRVLADGRVVFLARRGDESGSDVLVASADGRPVGQLELPPQVSEVLVDSGGAVVYGQNGRLIAQRINWGSLRLEGATTILATDVTIRNNVELSASLSPAGVLAYRQASLSMSQFEWVNRTGRTIETLAPVRTFTTFDLSPDESHIAVIQREQGRNSLWMIDMARSLVTPNDVPNQDPPSDPTWSPDGKEIAIRRGQTIVARPAFGGAERIIVPWHAYPDSWSRDGRYLAVGRPVGPNYELWVVRTDGSGEAIPIVQGTPQADEPRFSPDGRWIAFHGVPAGGGSVSQVYAVPFPPTGERWQLSTNGGVQPRWRGDGAELFYLDGTGVLMRVPLPGGDPRRAGIPEPLFRTTIEPSSVSDQYTVARDGQRFLLRRAVSRSSISLSQIHVLVGWRKIAGLE